MSSGFDPAALLRLALAPGIGSHRLRALVAHFGSPERALEASAGQLTAVEGVERKTAESIRRFQPEAGPLVEAQTTRMAKASARLVSFWDDEYPDLLRQIYDPPAFLFVRGAFEPGDCDAVGIVGTRRPTAYGRGVALGMGQSLAGAGMTVVSGLARGIDTSAHTGAVKSGRTVAVLGSGVDVIYPAENATLAAQIADGRGAVVSEYLMGAGPDPGNFPRRNRIISGMSLGTLVVEAAETGGALITAAFALDQNRDVFAIPGPITETRSSGTNKLIQDGGARLVRHADDILRDLAPRLRGRAATSDGAAELPPPDLTATEAAVYGALDRTTPIHIDALAETLSLGPSDLLVQLLTLEFKSLVRQLAGKMFLRV